MLIANPTRSPPSGKAAAPRQANTGRHRNLSAPWSIPGFMHTWCCVTQLRQVALL